LPYATARLDYHHSGVRSRPVGYQGGATAALRHDLLDGYDVFNLVLTSRDLPVELQLGVYNLFDASYFDPDFAEGKFDREWPRRSIMGQVSFKL
jgi:outer membrane receptor protein involved in Fe transport